ncbi:MAG: DUF1080 domain-containing protein [Rubripirellula sp.]
MKMQFTLRTLIHASAIASLTLSVTLLSGCSKSEPSATPTPEAAAVTKPKAPIAPQAYEASAEQLLAVRLPTDEAAQGWIRLFDGQTLFGWEITGAANWRVEDGKIIVDDGEKCLLCTSMPWQDYELELEYSAGPKTNSGVFLRTPLAPEDPALDCYEVNIAPTDNPFPTAGIVDRQKADDGVQANVADSWRTMRMVLDGKSLKVSVDGKLVNDFTDPVGLSPGRIGLQHNSGRIEFRNIRLRPLGLTTMLDEDLAQWTKYPKMPGEFTITDDGALHVQGGRTQLESKESYGDFVMLAEYRLPKAELNSGIFFRCIPGEEMMGYECQLSNEAINGNRLAPADTGTGGIFKRQDARFVAGEVDEWTTLVLVAHGQKIGAWVQGVQVSNWFDDRKPDTNPRRGLRLEPGTIMIQGHDPTTDAKLKQIMIRSIE